MIATLLRLNKSPNAIGALTIDATLTEIHNRTATVTQFALDNGASVSDHVINQPKTISLEGVISNTPLVWLGLGADNARAQNAFDALDELYDSKEPFDLVTGFKLYKNCVFRDLSLPRVRAGELRFRATVVELKFVEQRSVPILASSLAQDDAILAGTTNLGQVQGANVAPEQSASILAKIFGGNS